MNSPDRPPVALGYSGAQVRAARDDDRQRYRRAVIWLVLYQFIVAIPVRLALDFLVTESKFRGLYFLKPYILVAIAILVLLIWLLGLPQAFRRRY